MVESSVATQLDQVGMHQFPALSRNRIGKRLSPMTLTIALFYVFIIAGCGGTGSPPPPSPIDQNSIPVRDLRIEVGCSEERIRVNVARVLWRSDPSLHERQRIDAAVTTDGFASGFYATVPVLAEVRRFQQADSLARQRQTRRALDSLLVVRVVRSPVADSVVVDIEGLEPRVNYYWRVATSIEGEWITSPPVRVQAPVCLGGD